MTTTRYHHVLPVIDSDGRIRLSISCAAPEGAECRLWCDEGCEQAGADHAEYHELTDQGYCAQVSGWFDDDVEDLYSGADQPLRPGSVELFWEGDYYSWRYADEEVAW